LSSPSPNHIRAAHEAFWNWVFREDDDNNHPLTVSKGGIAQEQFDNMLIVAGSLPDAGHKDRTLDIRNMKDIEYIFVPVDNCVDTLADAGGVDVLVLVDKITKDIRDATGKYDLSINGQSQKNNIALLEPHLFSLSIVKAIKETGRKKMGEGTSQGRKLPILTTAVAACYYLIIPANNLKNGDKIGITTRFNISVEYTVKV
jgi:hypothetical protein